MTVDSTKMILLHAIVFVFGITRLVSGANDSDVDSPYCFQFTFLGSMPAKETNCSAHHTTPCFPPFVYTHDGSPPNVTYMWEKYNRSEIGCPMDSAHTCMKYTWIFNNAVLNTSYFCGKVIEDSTTAVLSGCFSQQMDGHTVEACACQSRAGQLPCNSSNVARLSIGMLIILTFVPISFLHILSTNNRIVFKNS